MLPSALGSSGWGCTEIQMKLIQGAKGYHGESNKQGKGNWDYVVVIRVCSGYKGTCLGFQPEAALGCSPRSLKPFTTWRVRGT